MIRCSKDKGCENQDLKYVEHMYKACKDRYTHWEEEKQSTLDTLSKQVGLNPLLCINVPVSF